MIELISDSDPTGCHTTNATDMRTVKVRQAINSDPKYGDFWEEDIYGFFHRWTQVTVHGCIMPAAIVEISHIQKLDSRNADAKATEDPLSKERLGQVILVVTPRDKITFLDYPNQSGSS
jgi:hypothetical protein